MNKKIAHILPAYYTQNQYNLEGMASVGGGERYPVKLAKEQSKKYKTTLIAFGDKAVTFMDGDLTVKILRSSPTLKNINGNVNFVSLKLFFLLKGFDVIHAHQYYADTTLTAVIAAKIFRKRLFITDHGWRGLNISRYIPMKVFADKILGQSNYEIQRLGLKHNKFGLIWGGVDIPSTGPIHKNGSVIFLGRILPHKGINYLIDALGPKTRCIIAGHVKDQKYYELLQTKALNKNVEFVISAKDEYIQRLLSEASVLVLPSVETDIYGMKHNNAELFGLVIAEAFAHHTPVVTTDVCALGYVVSDGIDGYVVQQNNTQQINEKLDILLSDKKMSLRMGNSAYARVKDTFNWSATAEKCYFFYFSNHKGDKI